MPVNKAFIGCKEILGTVQHMPLKSSKRGIKVWILCTLCIGYVYNFNIHMMEKNDAVKRSNNRKGYDAVMNLINHRWKNIAHYILTNFSLQSNCFVTSLKKKYILVKLW